MIEEQELVSWLAFPEIARWNPFLPLLEFEVRQAERRITPAEANTLETSSLAEAVRLLGGDRFLPVVYRACSQLDVELDPTQRETHYELDWSISDPSGARPRRIRQRSKSRLWSRRKQRLGYFALNNSLRDFTIHLIVGGATPEECVETWVEISRWIRKLFKLQLPKHRMALEVELPLRPRSEIDAEARALRLCIREAVLEAARLEDGPFRLKGRGHEPRVALSVRLAAILRGLDLPSAHISGYGPNNFYPYRVLDRAAKMLEEKLRRTVLLCDGDRVYLKA